MHSMVQLGDYCWQQEAMGAMVLVLRDVSAFILVVQGSGLLLAATHLSRGMLAHHA